MSKAIIKNPIIWSDVPDVDCIRVNDSYYMISTSMHTLPGCPIMKSKDLANWETIGYLYDILENNDGHNLANGVGVYGQGSWAPSLRYNDGTFYIVFSCNDTKQFYVFRTNDIESGKWERNTIPQVLHDPALIFDEDGTPYVIYACGDVKIVEFEKDMSGIKEGGLNEQILDTPRKNIGLRCEGGHAYKINGMYYLIYIEWPTDGDKMRREVCYRSKNLTGPYERKVIFNDNMGYHDKGIAQGAIFDTQDGDWFAMLFQDHDAVGRIPYILPVKWEDGWPIVGIDGKAPEQFESPFEEVKTAPISVSDDFNYDNNTLKLNWQWNHNPDNSLWSFTENSGYLRMTTGYITHKGILNARNTLTQRTVGPKCSADTHVELTGMKDGDCTGMLALQSTFGMVGVRKNDDGTKSVVMCTNDGTGSEKEEETITYINDDIYLKVDFDFTDSIDIAKFYYSEDNITWNKIGCDVYMKYTLDHFMGYRIGLFNYATKDLGGYADFEYFNFQ